MKTGLILVLAFGASDAFHLKFPERLRPKVSSSALAANGIASTDSARAKKTSAFTDWSTGNAIQLGGIGVSAGEVAGGLGLVAINDLKPGDIVVQVPTKMVLSVQSPGEYNRGARELFDDKSAYKDAPWWAQLSVQLNRYDKVNSKDMDSEIDMKGWLDSLPRKFDTPIHWSDDILAELQYDYLSDSVLTQRRQWAEQRVQNSLAVHRRRSAREQTPERVVGAVNPLADLLRRLHSCGSVLCRHRRLLGRPGRGRGGHSGRRGC